ncbi:hypothetical protein PFNF135_04949 [Plasmodium falciparum NF135/5.C10]|uniref:Uncharacterized protein n=1 Tax=Plasmodium falciparum NF135/5.C10 TaxID=1036726 RepID=W4IAC6_PLAFA|nr:hypothetical protein PFNF135_04949 [Plasmodium falciparum NF135/5.C10]
MVNPPFDINYFLSSCTNLEKSYEHLLKEKKLYELKLNQALISLQEINEKYEEERKIVLEYKEKINDLIKQNEEREKKNKEALENIRNINDNLALNNLRNKLKLLQEDYNDLEKEYLYLKKGLSKTSTKKHLITKRIQGKSICNNKISYKI